MNGRSVKSKQRIRKPKHRIRSPMLSLSLSEMSEHKLVFIIVTAVIGLSVTSFTVSNAYSGYMMQTIQDGLQGTLTGDVLILGPNEGPRSALGGANPFEGYTEIGDALEERGLKTAPRLILQGAAFYKMPSTITGMEINKLLESRYEGLVLIGIDLEKDPNVFTIKDKIVEGSWFDQSEIHEISEAFWGEGGVHHEWEYEGLGKIEASFSLAAIDMRFMTVFGRFPRTGINYQDSFTSEFVMGFYSTESIKEALDFTKISKTIGFIPELYSEHLLRAKIVDGSISAEALKALATPEIVLDKLSAEEIKALISEREFSFGYGDRLVKEIGCDRLIQIVDGAILLDEFQKILPKLTISEFEELVPDADSRVKLVQGRYISPQKFKNGIEPQILRQFSSKALAGMLPADELLSQKFLGEITYGEIYASIPAEDLKRGLYPYLEELSEVIVPEGILDGDMGEISQDILIESFLPEVFLERFDDETISALLKEDDFGAMLAERFNPNNHSEKYRDEIELLERVRADLEIRLAQLEKELITGDDKEGTEKLIMKVTQLRNGLSEGYLKEASPHLPLAKALEVYGGIEDFALPVILGKSLADNLNLTIGEIFNAQLMTGSTLGSMGGSSNCIIVGIYQMGIPLLEQMVQIVPLSMIRMILTADGKYLAEDKGWGDDTVVAIGVETGYGPDAKPSKMKAAVLKALPEQYRDKVTILTWSDMVEYVAGPVMTVINVMLLLSIFVTLLLCAMTIKYVMDSTVLRKTREIGTLKAVGATSSSVAGIFLIQALIIGVLASLIGFASSATILYGLNSLLGGGSVVGTTIDVWFVLTWRWWVLALIFVMPVAVSLVSALIPAYRAAKLTPVESIRKGDMAL